MSVKYDLLLCPHGHPGQDGQHHHLHHTPLPELAQHHRHPEGASLSITGDLAFSALLPLLLLLLLLLQKSSLDRQRPSVRLWTNRVGGSWIVNWLDESPDNNPGGDSSHADYPEFTFKLGSVADGESGIHMLFTNASSVGCCRCVSSARFETFLPLRADGGIDAPPGLDPVSRPEEKRNQLKSRLLFASVLVRRPDTASKSAVIFVCPDLYSAWRTLCSAPLAAQNLLAAKTRVHLTFFSLIAVQRNTSHSDERAPRRRFQSEVIAQ